MAAMIPKEKENLIAEGTFSNAYLTATANAVFLHPVFIFLTLNPIIIHATFLPQASLQLVYLQKERGEVGLEKVETKLNESLFSIRTYIKASKTFRHLFSFLPQSFHLGLISISIFA